MSCGHIGDGLRKGDVDQRGGLLIVDEGAQASEVDNHQPGIPRLAIGRRSGVAVGGIPDQQLPGLHDSPLGASTRLHRPCGDDTEDVLPAVLDGVVGGLAGHQQDPILLLERHILTRSLSMIQG